MNQETLITSPLGVGAVITLLIWVSFWLDQKYRFFSFLGTAILVISGGAILVNLHVIPPSLTDQTDELNPIYQFAGDYGVPLAIVLFLLSTDFRNLRQLGKPAVIAFSLAAIGTVCGTVLGGLLMADKLGEEGWKITGQFAASYIGGGINYAAVGNALDTSETMYATGAAADNIMTNIWMVGTAVIPVLLRRFYPSIHDKSLKDEKAGDDFWQAKKVTIYDLVALIAIAFFIVAVSEWITSWIHQGIGFEIPSVIWYTTFALLIAWFTPVSRFQGGAEIGNFMLHLFLLPWEQGRF